MAIGNTSLMLLSINYYLCLYASQRDYFEGDTLFNIKSFSNNIFMHLTYIPT